MTSPSTAPNKTRVMATLRKKWFAAFLFAFALNGTFVSAFVPNHQVYLKNPPPFSLDMSTSPSSTTYDEASLDLSTGVQMQVLSKTPIKQTSLPPLLFLHGSFHGAWCWTEKYFQYFVDKGYPVVAPSWRGTGGTYAGDGVKKVQIAQHVADFNALLKRLPEVTTSTEPPVIICHSFGGVAVMKALEEDPSLCGRLGGVVMMCSVPPSGNGKLTIRTMRRSLKDSYKITMGFAAKRCIKKEDLCRDLFFGGTKDLLPDGTMDNQGIPSEDVKRYQSYFARDSAAIIDLLDLAKKLPSATVDKDGRAAYVAQLPPSMVLGATRDFIVDSEGVEETARYFGVSSPILVDSPHDVMLGRNWEYSAEALATWLRDTKLS